MPVDQDKLGAANEKALDAVLSLTQDMNDLEVLVLLKMLIAQFQTLVDLKELQTKRRAGGG